MFYIVHRPDCPWCDKAIDLISELTNEDWECTNIYENKLVFNLFRKAGLNTVPQIWYKDEYIGGYSQLYDWFNKHDR